MALYPSLFSVAGKDTQCGGERKEKLFLLQRELGVGGGLKVHSCRTEGILKGSGEFMMGEGQLRGEFQE